MLMMLISDKIQLKEILNKFHLKLASVSADLPIAGAKVWNGLPEDVTSAPSLSTFRRHLKTHLFRCCYNTV